MENNHTFSCKWVRIALLGMFILHIGNIFFQTYQIQNTTKLLLERNAEERENKKNREIELRAKIENELRNKIENELKTKK